jgi:hypothetical protein
LELGSTKSHPIKSRPTFFGAKKTFQLKVLLHSELKPHLMKFIALRVYFEEKPFHHFRLFGMFGRFRKNIITLVCVWVGHDRMKFYLPNCYSP